MSEELGTLDGQDDDDSAGPDQIRIDLWVRWETPPPSEFAPTGCEVFERKGQVSWKLRAWDFAPPHWRDRQLSVDQALDESLALIRQMNQLPPSLGRRAIQLWIELHPKSMTAGIVLQPELLRPLVEENVIVMLNAL
ncbi:MAG: hypothetical protein DI534_02335 [Leifsonia xyli]|nr:MAG: hypothetical protein DI534_02335 [Leifsonia xyli]